MTVRLYAMTCGWVTMRMRAILDGEGDKDSTLVVPIPSYLIEHPKGRVLFDSGLNLAVQHDYDGYMGGLTKYMQAELKPGEELVSCLKRLDRDVADIDYVVNSHLHFDHCGGNGEVPNAAIVIQKPEWEYAQSRDPEKPTGYKREDYDHGQDVQQVSGEHDIFGDGSVVCIPTYGHTPGHQSLKVRHDGGEVVLAGDACYLRQTLDNLHLPAIVHDREQMIASLHVLRGLQARGARIYYGHDPEFWQTVPQAPAPMV